MIVIGALLTLICVRVFQGANSSGAPDVLESGTFTVARVIDGDTLRLDSGARLRLQGVDAPETAQRARRDEPWGREATQYTRRFIQNANGRIRVEFGPERKDRYGRYLGFVYHEDRLLNEELVSEGLARAATQYHYSDALKRRLQRAEHEAQGARRGIWSRADE